MTEMSTTLASDNDAQSINRELHAIATDSELRALGITTTADATRDAEITMLDADFNAPGYGEQPADTEQDIDQESPVRSKKGIRKFGHGILNAGSWVNQTYYTILASGIGALPGAKSKEEILEADRLRQERFAVEEGDKLHTRAGKFLGRNAVKMAAWAPAGLMGIIVASSLIRPAIPVIEGIDVQNLPFEYSSKTTVLAIGGHAQGMAYESGYVDSLKATGIIKPGEETNVKPINWTAQMSPLPGDTMSMEMSDAEGARQIVSAIDAAGGGEIKVLPFSQGTEATLRALNEIANRPENGGRLPDNVHVILQGTPSGAFGMNNNTVVGMVNPILKQLGLEVDQPIPEGNITVRTHVNDVFGNSADQSAAFTGLMAVSPGHVVVGEENAVLLYTYKEGSTTYEVWGPKSGMNHPVSQLLEANGYHVTPELDDLFEAAIPRTEHGQPTEYTDVAATAEALGVYIDSQMGNLGIASRFIDRVMTPEMTEKLQRITDLQSLEKDFAEMAANPALIPQKLQEMSSKLNIGAGEIANIVNPEQWANVLQNGNFSSRMQSISVDNFAVAPAPAAQNFVSNLQNRFQEGGGAQVFQQVAQPDAPAPAAPAVQNFVSNLQNRFQEREQVFQQVAQPDPAPAPAPAGPAAQESGIGGMGNVFQRGQEVVEQFTQAVQPPVPPEAPVAPAPAAPVIETPRQPLRDNLRNLFQVPNDASSLFPTMPNPDTVQVPDAAKVPDDVSSLMQGSENFITSLLAGTATR